MSVFGLCVLDGSVGKVVCASRCPLQRSLVSVCAGMTPSSHRVELLSVHPAI